MHTSVFGDWRNHSSGDKEGIIVWKLSTLRNAGCFFIEVRKKFDKHFLTTKKLRLKKKNRKVQKLHFLLTTKCKYCIIIIVEVQYECD